MIKKLLAQAATSSKGNLGTFKPPSSPYGFAVGQDTKLLATSKLEQILSIGIGAITIVAGVYFLFVFILAAFTWLSAGGEASKVTKARDSMMQGLLGLLIIVATYAIVGVIGSLFGIDILKPGSALLSLDPVPKLSQ